MQIDETKLNEVVGRLATEITGAWGVVSIHLGVRLGLYDVLAEGPVTAAGLAERTGCNLRLIEEWLTGQAVCAYVSGDGAGRFHLEPEQAMALADPNSPAYVGGFTEVLVATVHGEQRIDAAFRGDGKLAWGDQDPALFSGFERSFGPVYRAALLAEWLPALDGVEDRLSTGARVADIGAGQGTAVRVMAEAFPASTFTAIDVHRGSLDAAEKSFAAAGVTDRARVEQASGTTYSDGPYDLITFFDALHDMGDPEQVIANARRQVADDGVLLVVEPMVAGGPDDDAGEFAARLFYPSSAMLCTPSALAGGESALGNQVPDATWERLFSEQGFGTFRRAAETPFNRIFEIRP